MHGGTAGGEGHANCVGMPIVQHPLQSAVRALRPVSRKALCALHTDVHALIMMQPSRQASPAGLGALGPYQGNAMAYACYAILAINFLSPNAFQRRCLERLSWQAQLQPACMQLKLVA